MIRGEGGREALYRPQLPVDSAHLHGRGSSPPHSRPVSSTINEMVRLDLVKTSTMMELKNPQEDDLSVLSGQGVVKESGKKDKSLPRAAHSPFTHFPNE